MPPQPKALDPSQFPVSNTTATTVEQAAAQKAAALPIKPPTEGGVFSSQSGLKSLNSAVATETRITPPPPSGGTSSGASAAPTTTSGASGGQSSPQQPSKSGAGLASAGTGLTLINKNTGQTLTYNDADLNRQAIQTYLGTGIWDIESGNPPSWITPSATGGTTAKAPTAEEMKRDQDRAVYEEMIGKIGTFKQDMATDPALANILSGIESLWGARIAEQERSNKSREAAMTTAGMRTGARWAGGFRPGESVFGGIISAEERAGARRIDEMIAQKNSALAEARSAYEQREWTRYVQLIDIAEKKYAISRDEVAKLNEIARKEEEKREAKAEKAKEIEFRSSRDAAITDLIAQGIKDPIQIMDALNFDENGTLVGDITFKEVSDITKALKEAEKAAPGVVGEWIAAKENDPTLAGISLQDYIKLKDPTLALDMQAKRLQIAKLEKEIAQGDQPDIDAANLLAYAQQYATAGTIPTGLPKGTFGMVSQVAKELPKGTGTIVNKTTGIADSKTPAAEQQDYSRLYTILRNVERLKTLDEKRIGGLVGGILGKAFGSNDQAAYLAVRKAIVDDMQRMQSGAALTPDEMAFYADYLPGRFSEPLGILGQDSIKKIENFESIMSNRLNERLSNNGLAIYGFSKVKINGKEYTVGDVVEGVGGKTGRVLADGTISINE